MSAIRLNGELNDKLLETFIFTQLVAILDAQENNGISTRLTKDEIMIIKECFFAQFEKNDHLWLFGSRVDDNARGGDIDLYIDIFLNILSLSNHQSIYDIAKKTGVQLA